MSTKMRMINILFSLLYSSALMPLADCFLSTKTPVSFSSLSFQKMSSSELHSLHASASDEMGDTVNGGSLEIVLFGLGDLRVNDHEGLVRAMERARAGGNNAKVLPVFVLDDASLMSFPGARTALYDSATMVSSAIRSLDERLRVDLNLGPLQVCFGDTRQCVEEISSQFQGDTTVHVCDLGTVDNSLGYGSYSRLAQSYGDFSFDLRPWMCQLRDEPWDAIYGDDDAFPDSYPRFKKLFGKIKVNKPIPLPEKVGSDEGLRFSPYPLAEEAIVLPSAKDVAERFMLNMYESESPKTDLELERSTGLFGTHWGGINDAVCDEKDIMLGLKSYKKVCGDDYAMLQSKWYSSKKLQKNKRSLEHSAISWMSNEFTSSSNLIEGELMVRYLSAPLLLGCVSSRQLWYSTPDDETLLNSITLSSNPLRDMAEASEWHKLFASQNINQDERNVCYDDDVTNVGSVKFGYWRWQGFLCRYVVSRIREKSAKLANESALLLVHGFGASGSQWSKNMHELSSYAEKYMLTEGPDLAYAPDLIGFGQSEKPAFTYTQYLWESYTQAFIKEICQGKFSSGDFIVGGNSIGGYTAMGSAADDMVSSDDENFVSCSGAPGSGSCKGVFLMNSAGQINPKEMELENTLSVAELTATGKLPPCR